MRDLFRASVIGVTTGVVSFLILAGLLLLLLLILTAVRHSHPDLSLVMKIALPVAAVTTVFGFIVALVRLKTIDKHR